MKNSWVFLAGLTSLTIANLMIAAVSSSESAEPAGPPVPVPVAAAPKLPAVLWFRPWGAVPPLPLPCGRFQGGTRAVPHAGESAHAETLSSEVW